MEEFESKSRRRFLRKGIAAGTISAIGLAAGCTSDNSGGSGGSNSSGGSGGSNSSGGSGGSNSSGGSGGSNSSGGSGGSNSSGGSGGNTGEKVTLTISDGWPDGHPIRKAFVDPFEKEVTEKTNGQVQWNDKHNGQLHETAEGLEALQGGITDVTNVVPSFVSDKMPLSNVGVLPATFENAAQGSRAYYRLSNHELFNMELESLGIKPLITITMPKYQLFTNEKVGKVTSLDDWNGKTIRSSGVQAQGIEALGGSAQNMPTSDVFSALQQGVVDGAASGYSSAETYDWIGPANYATKAGNIHLGTTVIGEWINMNTYKKLPTDIQNTLVSVGEKYTTQGAKSLQNGEEKIMNKLVDKGKITAYKVPDDEWQTWESKLKPVAQKWANSTQGGEKILEKWRKYLKKAKSNN